MIPTPQPRDRDMATSPDGTRIAWWRYGSGDPAILFVPTWNLVDSRVIGHQIAALEQHATVVRYDPRGAGESDRPDTGYDFPFHAADALAVMDATGLRFPSIVTASRGLNAAILLAAWHPQRVDRLVSIGSYMKLEPNPAPPDPARLEQLRTDWAGFIGPFMHHVFNERGSEDLIREMITIGLDASPEAVVRQELEIEWTRPAALLGSVFSPTLLIHGEADAPVPPSLARDIAAAMPNAQVEVIPGGGHRPDIRSPELVNPLLLEFLLGETVETLTGVTTGDGT